MLLEFTVQVKWIVHQDAPPQPDLVHKEKFHCGKIRGAILKIH